MVQPTPPVVPPEFRAPLLKLIAEATGPLKAAAVVKLAAGLPKKVTGKAVQAFLEEDLRAGRVFNWGTEKTPSYWHRDKEAEARERVLLIAAQEALAEKDLVARAAAGAPALTAAFIKKALARETRLKVLNKVVVDLEHPGPYLEREISRLLESVGRAGLADRVLAAIAGKAAGEPPRSSVQEVAAKMFEAMNRIAFSPGTTVTFYRLRQQPELAEVPKAIFDEAALLLQRERKALLSLHDHAPALPAEERERFVTDGLGTYYVSIYAR